MDYTKEYFKDVVSRYGEVFFVLDSGEQYEIHGTDSFEFKDIQNPQSVSGTYTIVNAAGLRDGEWLEVEFPLDSIEHHYTHKEL